METDDLFALAYSNMTAYAALMHHSWQSSWHHHVLAKVLERVVNKDPAYRKLIISLPPRHGKSELISKLFPGWYLGRHPHESVIAASYGADLSQEIGRHSRDYVNQPAFQRLFGTTVRTDSNAVTRWELTNGGTFHVTSVNGALTGKGANVLLLDDPIKNAEDANSPAIKEKIWQWFLSTAYTRLEKQGAVIVVATRWATDDLSGRLLALPDSDWREIKFPAIATKNERFRAEGDALWPEKMPLAELGAIQRISGRKIWSALWQQSPTVDGGAVFREEWLRYYDPQEMALRPPPWKQIIQTWDTGVSAKSSSARSACVTIGVAYDATLRQDAYYVLDVWADQVAFPDLVNRARLLATRYDADEIWVEEQQTGRPLVDTLKMEMGSKIRGVRLKGDKMTRASAASVLFETGRVYLPAEGVTSPPWAKALIEEMMAFPAGEFVDRIDALSQGLIMLQKTGFRHTRTMSPDPYGFRSPMPVSIYGR